MNFKTLFGKYVYILAVVTLLGSGGLFAYLSQEGIKISCDIPAVCDKLECVFYCDFYNSDSNSKYIYNYDDFKLSFAPEVSDFKMFVKYYGKWKFTNFTMSTRLGNVPKDRKYVFVFPAKTTKSFKFVVSAKESKIINIFLDEYKGQLKTWKVNYETCFKTVPIYEYNVSLIPSVYNINGSWSDSYNITNKILMGYDDVEFVCGKRLGVDVGYDFYSNSNVVGDKLHKFNIDVGDRNWNEFPCRDWEQAKGVCEVIKLA